MLERILPPTFDAAQLPERGSRGAQAHAALLRAVPQPANPAMHHAEKWPAIVERMVLRMEGKRQHGHADGRDDGRGEGAERGGDARRSSPTCSATRRSRSIPQRYPEVNRPSGEAFRLACNQCHVLPDPQRHTAAEWRAVVARMQENMEWMNRVVGSKPVPGEPQLRVEEINAFLREVRAER